MDTDDHGVSEDESSLLTPGYLTWLSPEEAKQIEDQFCKVGLKPGCQVMWSGVPRDWVQRWADQNDMQTLTSAMGPLMNPTHPACRKTQKSKNEWSAYVRGASSLFASYMPKGDVVTVLTRPPPYRSHPQGLTTYQSVELPILMGKYGGASVSRIEMVHVTVIGAENSPYQMWPNDNVSLWLERHGSSQKRRHWPMTSPKRSTRDNLPTQTCYQVNENVKKKDAVEPQQLKLKESAAKRKEPAKKEVAKKAKKAKKVKKAKRAKEAAKEQAAKKEAAKKLGAKKLGAKKLAAKKGIAEKQDASKSTPSLR